MLGQGDEGHGQERGRAWSRLRRGVARAEEERGQG